MNKSIVVISLFAVLALMLVHQGSSLTMQDLLNGYSYDYSSGSIGINNVTDFMLDTNANSVNDTLFFNMSIYNGTLGNYVFYVDLQDNGTILTQKNSFNINSLPTSVLMNVSSGML